ncbi:MAG TPA: CPBP family intramembrane glutamic endopeptidase, partial [Thermoanaerobaculia bacterium]|nr:CPBP family intramembrane glutamic endopeptidase [Thermoanaerobaculia bacterium]
IPKDVQPPAMVGWIATLPVWKKCVLVLSAMTVEEAFFRGWLQKRIGLIASTVCFALAHAGYGQPFLLIGVALISLVIGFTFYRTKNIIPGVIAHGVFDAVQLFVIIPIAFKAAGLGG